MILGNPQPGADQFDISGPVTYLYRPRPETLAADFVAAGLLMRLNGLATQSGSQTATPVVVLPDGTAHLGEQIIVAGGDPTSWRSMRFPRAPRLTAGTLPTFGITVSGGLVMHGYSEEDADGAYRSLSPAQDGQPPESGAWTLGASVSVCLLGVAAWTPPPATDEDLARMPYDVAQAALSGSAAPATAAWCGWHGPSVDPETGYFAVARTGGPLADAVGERVRVTNRRNLRSVIVLLHDEQDFDGDDEDISLSARAFGHVGRMAADRIPVRVEVLA